MFKRKSIYVSVSVILLLTLMVLVACAQPAPAPTPTPSPTPTPEKPEQLIIGVVAPISGPVSFIAMTFVRGYELFFDKINQQGGLKIGNKTYTFKVIAEDSKLSAEAAGNAAKKLVLQDKAKFVFGAILEFETAAITEITQPNNALHLILWINDTRHPADVSPNKPLCVRPIISPDASLPVVLDYLKEKYPNVKTLVTTHGEGIENIPKTAVSIAEAKGYKVLSSEMWPFATVDFVPTFTKVLAFKPDAILALVSAQANDQLRAARQLGYKGPFISNSPLGPDVIIRTAGAEASTNVICAGWDPDYPTEVQREVMDRWKTKYTDPFVSDAVFAWDEAWILVQAMQKAQSIEPGKIISALDTMTNVGDIKTSFGNSKMGGKANYGVNRVLVRPIPISHIMNGKNTFIGNKLSPVE